MNYQNYSGFKSYPPQFGNEKNVEFGDDLETFTKNNMTVYDIYRTPFLLTQDHNKNFNNMANDALKGIHCKSKLSNLFFSDKNIQRIQKMIKKKVFEDTKGKFRLDVDQEYKDVYIVMRAIFLEHARNLPSQEIRQCKRLNEKVINEIVPPMLTEIKQYYGYMREINKPLTPIPREINVNNAGRKTLPSISTLWSV